MLQQIRSDQQPTRAEIQLCVRTLLDQLAQQAPGRSVEIRIPPYGAVQAVPGVNHRRGTPPAVVEMDVTCFLELVVGSCSWDQAVAERRIHASGERSDLTPYFPFEVQ
jgi:hypothetical protein